MGMKPQIARAACWYIPKCRAQSIPNIEAEVDMEAEEAIVLPTILRVSLITYILLGRLHQFHGRQIRESPGKRKGCNIRHEI